METVSSPEITCTCSGLLTGTLSADRVADAAAASDIREWYIACVLLPVSDMEVQEKIQENQAMAAWLDPYHSFQRIYGNASRRVEELPEPQIINAVCLLREENEFLMRNMGEGYVRSIVRFGTADRPSWNRLASLIGSCMNCDSDMAGEFEPIRVYPVSGQHRSLQECIAIPCVTPENCTVGAPVHISSWQNASTAASFCIPPMESHHGYYLKEYTIDENSLEVFGKIRPVTEDSICTGTLTGGGKAVIPLVSLLSHGFISGSTNSGKTTTVKRILKELHSCGIPFTVIEAAKKEYVQMFPHIDNLKIYSSGIDGIPLAINPLQPEEGVLIENHVAAVVRSLIASTGGEHPIPEAYEGLLKQTYAQFGWKYGTLAWHDPSKPFPTMADVLENIDSYIENHARYGAEVRQNITGALTLRTENMSSGALGTLFARPSGLTAKEILSSPSVIELADFSEQATAFLMNILLYKFHSYLSRLPEERGLRRMIVVEEAHNVFRKTSTEESALALSNRYFEKMLAEIRSSGTGILMSDQRPGIMSEAVIANTAVKIVHGLSDPGDRKIMGEAMNLTDFQIRKISEFAKGECIIGLREQYGVQHSITVPLEEKAYENAACLSCLSRFRCKKDAVNRIIREMDPGRLRLHKSKIRSAPYNPRRLAQNIDAMLEDMQISAAASTKCCLLGKILQQDGSIPYQDCRIIVKSYREHLQS
ncbi:MAG: ATP-binding protein [Clostridia bacterium]|nr:ATP-binding protein [Clostridia bacterium]